MRIDTRAVTCRVLFKLAEINQTCHLKLPNQKMKEILTIRKIALSHPLDSIHC